MATERKRCSEHGVVMSDEGICVLCARKAQRSINRTVVWIVALAGVAGGAAAATTFGWHRHQDRELAALRAHPAVAVLPPIQIEPPKPPPESSPEQRRPDSAMMEATRKLSPADREKRINEAIKKVTVKVYVTDWCPVCTRARQWLREKGISYDELNIETSDSAHRELKELTGKGSIPTFVIDGIVDQGFSEQSVLATMRRAAEKRVAKEELEH